MCAQDLGTESRQEKLRSAPATLLYAFKSPATCLERILGPGTAGLPYGGLGCTVWLAKPLV